jgi:hypothetical protein
VLPLNEKVAEIVVLLGNSSQWEAKQGCHRTHHHLCLNFLQGCFVGPVEVAGDQPGMEREMQY